MPGAAREIVESRAQLLRAHQIALVCLVDRGLELTPIQARTNVDQRDQRTRHRDAVAAFDLPRSEGLPMMDHDPARANAPHWEDGDFDPVVPYGMELPQLGRRLVTQDRPGSAAQNGRQPATMQAEFGASQREMPGRTR
jgi:hypothetical protein